MGLEVGNRLLHILQLPVSNLQSHVLPDLHNRSLLSIGQFCDHGFQVNFNKTAMHLANYDTTIHGIRESSNGLYYIEINPQSSSPASGMVTIPHAENSAYSMTTKRDLVQYLHRADFSPVVSTCNKSIDAGYFATWNGLTSKLVCKHLPLSIYTTKGHLWQDCQNI